MKLFIKLLFALTGMMFSYSALAQTATIDVFHKNERQKRNIPGLQLAVIQNGKVVKLGNYGMADLQNSIPVSEKSLFYN